MKKILVLGAGLVGGPIALDLAKDSSCEVAVADIDAGRLEKLEGINPVRIDLLQKEELRTVLPFYDVAVNAVPGFMGFGVLKTCIESGIDVVDIAFYPEDPLSLNGLADKNGVRVICDMGVAPGMSNLLVGYAASELEKVNDVKIYVGGLPKIRTLPWEYKAVFSPVDVIEEYTRPARIVENGTEKIVEPLSGREFVDFEGVGTLEAFVSDGLRTLIKTVKAENMIEKTLRYPGYVDKIKLLKDNGFFSDEKLKLKGTSVSPLELTAQLLFEQWKLKKGEPDITLMRVEVKGTRKGEDLIIRYELHDEYDPDTGIHSMARTTGYTASMAVRLLSENLWNKKGITMPEELGLNGRFVQFILEGLKERKVIYRRSEF